MFLPFEKVDKILCCFVILEVHGRVEGFMMQKTEALVK